MSAPPERPKIFHITHVDNLAGIVADGGVSSDARRIARNLGNANIVMSNIKQRRLRWTMPGVPGRCVGDFVPFYFCPRSIMLYLIHCGNNAQLDYSGGQAPIVHLRADMHSVIEWAVAQQQTWAFTDANAATQYARYFTDTAHLSEINWPAVGAKYWSDPELKDGKQAEFLLVDYCPVELFEGVGVQNQEVLAQVEVELDGRLKAKIIPGWYY